MVGRAGTRAAGNNRGCLAGWTARRVPASPQEQDFSGGFLGGGPAYLLGPASRRSGRDMDEDCCGIAYTYPGIRHRTCGYGSEGRRGQRMRVELRLSELPNNAEEAKVVRICKKAGDEVRAGEVVFEIEAGKGSMSIGANASGRIESIEVEEGSSVNLGAVLAVIEGEVQADAITAGKEGHPARENKVAEEKEKTRVEEEAKAKEEADTFDYFSIPLRPRRRELESDITIIGAGPGGYVAAIHAAKLGARVVLVEKEAVGGTCLNRGCIPTKALVRSAEVYENLKEAELYGCRAEGISLDMKMVIERKNRIVQRLVKGIHHLLRRNGVELVTGTGEIASTESVRVQGKVEETLIKSKHIIIATGSRPGRLPIPGIGSQNVIGSREALDLEELPESLIIIGGGIIGMEFAFVFQKFGVNVSVIEYLDRVLASCDPDVCREIARSARAAGIKVYTGAKAEEIIETENGNCLVCFTQGSQKKYITGEKVLVAVGREPFYEGLGLENIGIELNEGGRGIKVNERLQTNVPNIYAIGDVTNRMLLAHVASHQGIVAVNNILGKADAMHYDAVPSAIFTDPEVGMVGIGEEAAKKKGLDIDTGYFPFVASGKALTLGKTRGFVKIVKEKAKGQVIGASIIGPHATDLIAELTVAIENKLTAEQIAKTIHAHPTTAEAIYEAALAAENGAIHFSG